jgi:outer membrane receptor protein involved in Fe transport
VAICLLLGVTQARADEPIARQFDISPQSLATALSEFARQSQQQILFAPEVVAQKVSGAVHGKMQPLAALKLLLKDTGLKVTTTPNGAILVGDPRSLNAGPTAGAISLNSGATLAMVGPASNVNQAQSGARSTERDAAPSSPTEPPLSEIVVTAQKREERLQDVPVPVTAINAEALANRNQLRLQDYYTSVPGLSVTTDDLGAANLTIRGLTTGGYTSPTVGVVVDDVPFGASSGLVTGEEVPDIDPSDLARVEVLRGPQGTLYGASSIGGLLKYVTVDPSTDALSGRVQAGTSSVYNGAGLGYNFRAAVNVPLSDTLAIRASGFTREDPGYIDDPVHHIDGVNEAHAAGGHLSALWRPSDIVSLKLSALYQHSTSGGSNEVLVQPGLGDLQQDNVPGTGGYDRTIQAYSATLTAKLGVVDLTSVTGYSLNRVYDSFDYTSTLCTAYELCQSVYGVSGGPNNGTSDTNKFTQEIRLSGAIGPRMEWLLGGFFNNERTAYTSDYLAANFDTGEIVGDGLAFSGPLTFKEYAVFSDLTFHLTDQFDIQVGGRESENRQTYSELQTGPYVPLFYGVPSPLYNPPIDTKDDSFTYLVTPRYKLSQDLMIYARLASGYRPGGPNIVSVGSVPSSFQPDKTQNYEVGVKGDVLDRFLSIDASIYYIDWKNIQLQLRDPTTGSVYFANGSRAKSQGVELSLESRPLTGLKVAAWVSFDDAVLTENFPPASSAVGMAGDRLPDSSRFSGNFSLDQDFSLTSDITGFAGASVSYVGSRLGIFNSPPPALPPRQYLSPYAKTDLRAGAKYETWTLNLFVNNLADKRGVLSGGLGTLNPAAFNYIQPRTVGILIAKTF